MSAPVPPAAVPDGAAPPDPRRNNLIGAGLMVLSVVAFTGLDTTMKVLVGKHDFWMLAWARNLAQVGWLLALMPLIGPARMLVAKRPGLQVARGLTLATSTMSILMSLKVMPLTQAYVAMLSAPLVAAMLSTIFLAEKASLVQWIAIVAGFAGVVIALGPGAPEIGLYLLLALAMALSLGTNHVLTRLGARVESPFAQLFYIAVGALAFLTPTLMLATGSLPVSAWAWVALAAAFGTTAHFLLILALGYAPPTIVSPMLYTQIIWAALAGYLVFDEVPTLGTIIGGVIVAASGIALVRSRA